eukprot:545806_1
MDRPKLLLDWLASDDDSINFQKVKESFKTEVGSLFGSLKDEMRLKQEMLKMFNEIEEESLDSLLKSMRPLLIASKESNVPINDDKLRDCFENTLASAINKLIEECPTEIQNDYWMDWLAQNRLETADIPLRIKDIIANKLQETSHFCLDMFSVKIKEENSKLSSSFVGNVGVIINTERESKWVREDMLRDLKVIKSEMRLKGKILEIFNQIQEQKLEKSVSLYCELWKEAKSKEILVFQKQATYLSMVIILTVECPKYIQDSYWEEWTPEMVKNAKIAPQIKDIITQKMPKPQQSVSNSENQDETNENVKQNVVQDTTCSCCVL